MLHFDKFDAWVTIDGQETVEYGVETAADEKKVTCWIASQLGKTFAVHVRSTAHPGVIAVYTRMDGKEVVGRVLYCGLQTPSTVSIDGALGENDTRPFMFSSLELSDDDRLLGQSSVSQDLGRIDVQLVPVLIASRSAPPQSYPSLETLKIHERSKKAVTQQVSLGQSTALPSPCRFAAVQRLGADLVNFSFRYRPLDVLRANDIAPPAARPPFPPAREVKPLRDTNSVEVKAEKKMKVKRGAGDVIDLTVDDAPPRK
ncbi:unnamed protein product, partial [Mycena citricolor]